MCIYQKTLILLKSSYHPKLSLESMLSLLKSQWHFVKKLKVLKFKLGHKRPRMAKLIFRKHSKVGHITLSELKMWQSYDN